MAWFAITSLMRTIELEFLQQPNPRVVLDNTQVVEALHGRLAKLLAFLEESENQFYNDNETMQDWRVRIKDGALRIEDDIESIVTDIYGREQRRIPLLGRLLKSFLQLAGIIDKWLPAESLHKTLQNAIEGTAELMKFVSSSSTDLQVTDIPSSSSRWIKRRAASDSTIYIKLQSRMVGHDGELNRIKDLLLQGSQKERRVVSIVGMGGIGKTTFAQTLCKDQSVVSHFDIVGWTTVSAQYNMRRMLIELYSSIMPITKGIINCKSSEEEEEEEVAELVHKCLMGRRYLIVLDDIWDTSAWDQIQRCFPDKNDGSWILLTTRLQEVASYTSSGHNYSLNMRFLDPEESWNLFFWRINYKYGLVVANWERIWRHIIVEYCKGLPLAIVIVAGLVQETDESLWTSRDFERINILFAKVSCELEEGISKILSLSYNRLPNALKVCFLYLGAFVEDSVIRVKKLIRLWIAEGFVKVKGSMSIEKVGEDHLKELVCRSLVVINNISSDGKIKSCKLHV